MTYLEIHDRAGQRWVPAGDYFTLGRSTQNRVVLHGATVSRNHARIVFQEGQAILEDLGSTYGTAVNGRHIRDWYALKNGDQIQLGDALILFHEGRLGNGHDASTPPHGLVAIPPNMVRCAHCGTMNLKTNTICYNCGNVLWRPTQPAAQPAVAARVRGEREPASAEALRGGLPVMARPVHAKAARRGESLPGWLLTVLVALSIVLLSLLSMFVGLLIANGSLASLFT